MDLGSVEDNKYAQNNWFQGSYKDLLWANGSLYKCTNQIFGSFGVRFELSFDIGPIVGVTKIKFGT